MVSVDTVGRSNRYLKIDQSDLSPTTDQRKSAAVGVPSRGGGLLEKLCSISGKACNVGVTSIEDLTPGSSTVLVSKFFTVLHITYFYFMRRPLQSTPERLNCPLVRTVGPNSADVREKL
jgi:hypothetical protein